MRAYLRDVIRMGIRTHIHRPAQARVEQDDPVCLRVVCKLRDVGCQTAHVRWAALARPDQ